MLRFFPSDIDVFIEPFTGGGSVFLNVKAKKYLLNDIDKNIIGIHKTLFSFSKKPDMFLDNLLKIIKKYNLSRSYLEDLVPVELKKLYPKTYYKVYNKEAYEQLRKHFNDSDMTDFETLYILMIYGFNRMIRLNSKGKFNLPVGNVDFNKNVESALYNYLHYVNDCDLTYKNKDWADFLRATKIKKKDFIYFDPPYLITFCEYNKLWNETHEKSLLNYLDRLNKAGARFAISNVTDYKGRKNKLFSDWAKKYNVHDIKSNYISYHNNSTKCIKEVLVTNYD